MGNIGQLALLRHTHLSSSLTCVYAPVDVEPILSYM